MPVNFTSYSQILYIGGIETPSLKFEWEHVFVNVKYSQTCVKRPYNANIFLAFQTGGCLLLHESSAESSCMRFLYYFHSAISNSDIHVT